MSIPLQNLVLMTNDAAAGGNSPGPGIRKFCEIYKVNIPGDITAASAGHFVLVPDFPGVITKTVLAFQGGADGTDALTVGCAVKKNGTTVASTEASVTKAAGTGSKTTYAAGTGITQSVLKTDGTQVFVAGDLITADITLTRTTPETEASQASVWVYVTKYAN